MEFEVTAIRKRPKSLAEMVGQDFVAATLANALNTAQTAHAYLFSGPRGTGKTSTARILAKSLNCENGPTARPCGTCPACAEIAAGAAPDVIEIDGASHTSVNDVREIKDEVLYPPQGSLKKIYIIDEVHMLSNSAFNALLKTIEEPPPYIVFVFATTEVHKVPATIRSRCQHFRFQLFSPQLIREKLAEAAGEIGREFENDALQWIAKEAAGSMRDAYTLFDQVASFSDERVTLEGIRETMGLVGLETTSEFLDACSAGNSKRALELLDEILVSGTAVDQILLELGDCLRNLVLMSYGIDKESILGLSVERFPEGPRRAWDTHRLECAAEDAFTLYRDIRYSLNPRYELELFAGRLCSLTERLEASDVLKRIRELRRDLAGGEGESDEDVKKKTSETAGLREFVAAASAGNAAARNVGGAGEGWTSPGSAESAGSADAKKPSPGPSAEAPPPPVPAPAAGDAAAVNPESAPSAGHESRPRPAGPEEKKTLLIAQVRKTNIALAAALEKASHWNWQGDTLSMAFGTPYETDLVKNESEAIRRAALAAGLPSFRLDARTEKRADEHGGGPGARAELVRQVFRGQVISKNKG